MPVAASRGGSNPLACRRIPPEQVPIDVLTITFAHREDDSPQPAYCLVLDCGLGLCLPTMISYSI